MRRASRKAKARIEAMRVGLRWARMSVSTWAKPSAETATAAAMAAASVAAAVIPLAQGQARGRAGQELVGAHQQGVAGKANTGRPICERRGAPAGAVIEIGAPGQQVVGDHQPLGGIEKHHPLQAARQKRHRRMRPERPLTGERQITATGFERPFRLAAAGLQRRAEPRHRTAETAEGIAIKTGGHYQLQAQRSPQRPGNGALLAMHGGQRSQTATIKSGTAKNSAGRVAQENVLQRINNKAPAKPGAGTQCSGQKRAAESA